MFDTLTHHGRKYISSSTAAASISGVTTSSSTGAGFIDITGPWR